MKSTPAWRSSTVGSEQGSVTVFVLLLTLCLAALLALVAEGGEVLGSREAAMAEAEQAARAGASVLSAGTVRAGGISSGGSLAVEGAEYVMVELGHAGVATYNNGTVTATVSPFEVSSGLLQLVGVGPFVVTATASAEPVDG